MVFQVSGIFSVPALADQDGGLDDLLVNLDTLWAEFLYPPSPDDLVALQSKCIDLARKFAQWEESRVALLKPTKIGQIHEKQNRTKIAAGYWPGRVETYFDLCVAGIWNVFRAARLLLLNLLVQISPSSEQVRKDAARIVESMIASVPYHLTENLQAFINGQAKHSEIPEPGKHLGGLLLMHPLYVAFKSPCLPPDVRLYLQECLLWIGDSMGLGQARLLALVSLDSWPIVMAAVKQTLF